MYLRDDYSMYYGMSIAELQLIVSIVQTFLTLVLTGMIVLYSLLSNEKSKIEPEVSDIEKTDHAVRLEVDLVNKGKGYDRVLEGEFKVPDKSGDMDVMNKDRMGIVNHFQGQRVSSKLLFWRKNRVRLMVFVPEKRFESGESCYLHIKMDKTGWFGEYIDLGEYDLN